ncbi:MAG: M48 family metallopeptidase [Bacteroidia bacterium]|nr:M48 family metallopeptidase [Bacteroidia bacterium]
MVVFLYYSILIILIANFIFERWLDYLNTTNWTSELPPELLGIYNEEKYQKSLEYEKVTYRFTLVTESLGFIAVLLIFAIGGFGWLDGIIRSHLSNPIHVSLIFFAIIGLISEIVSLPFTWYDTFVIEAKFGFNKTTLRVFIYDQIKGLIIGAIIGGLILYLIIWIYLIAGNLFWLYSLMVIAIFSIFMSMFYSSIIVPFFNKQTPLADGDLKSAIRAFSIKAGFLLDNVFVIDGSKRSTKANAYFTGLGRKKRIVLYDTLISEMNTEEIVAVLAHEIGHYKKHHVLSGLFFSLMTTAVMLYVFSLVSGYPAFARVLGSDVPGFHLAVISFGILYSPLSLVFGLGLNYRSRMNEYQADRFAAEKYKGKYLASALKKLSINNLSNLTPHPVYVFFHYSHPTLLQRLKKLAEIE